MLKPRLAPRSLLPAPVGAKSVVTLDIPLKKIEDALERDYFLTGEMPMEWGIVDKVINKRPIDPEALKVV